MSGQGYKDILKHGWHPEKEGGTRRGQIKKLIGRGDNEIHTKDHVARPLSSLRDPSTFAPPPKHIAAGGTGSVPALPPAQNQYQPPTYSSQPQPGHDTQPVQEAPAPPPRPYRVDTTGLTTASLPPPPVRQNRTGDRVLPPPQLGPGLAAAKPGPPKLPPRLPPRNGNASPTPPPALPGRTSTPETPRQDGLLNQSAVSRLGAAGISVPGFGIGKGRTPEPAPSSGFDGSADSGLQSRFSKLGLSSTGSKDPKAPAEGTTLAQKQAALKTAAAFRQDPSSVSISDAKAAASTFNNFRQRHGDQVAEGMRSANDLNKKYGVVDRVAGLTGQEGTNPEVGNVTTPAQPPFGLLAKKKPAPPPPPPKRKPNPGSQISSPRDDKPPPVPFATRPQF